MKKKNTELMLFVQENTKEFQHLKERESNLTTSCCTKCNGIRNIIIIQMQGNAFFYKNNINDINIQCKILEKYFVKIMAVKDLEIPATAKNEQFQLTYPFL